MFPRLAIALAAILWGTTGTAQALASTEAHPLAVGAVRVVLGASCLLLLAAIQDRPGLIQPWPRRLTLLAGTGVALYQVSFFAAVRTMGVAAGTVLAIGSAPVAAGILGLLVHRERPSLAWYPATALAISGCLFLGGTDSAWSWRGAPLALFAGFGYALSSACSKSILQTRRPETAMAGVFGVAALLLTPLFTVLDLGWLTPPRALAAMTYLGVFATALAYVLFSRGLATTPVASAVTLSLLEPLTAALLGLFLLHEPLTTRHAMGMGCILLGMGILALERPGLPKVPQTTTLAPECTHPNPTEDCHGEYPPSDPS